MPAPRSYYDGQMLGLPVNQTNIQWNPGLTICQGRVKITSLNRDIIIAEFPV